MTVEELIERLSELDSQATVLLAHQPSWPLQFEIAGVAASEDWVADTRCDEHGSYDCPVCRVPAVVYLVEGDVPQAGPYAPRAAWEVAR